VIALRDAVRTAFSPSPIPSAVEGERSTRPATVEVGWLGFTEPNLVTCIRSAAEHHSAESGSTSVVVVPLLLTSGYHARVDIPAMVAEAGISGVAVSATLGPDLALARALNRRLDEAGVTPTDDVVIGAAGSADLDALDDVAQIARLLADLRGTSVEVGFVTGIGARLDAALEARDRDQPVGVATYLLGAGSMADAVRTAASGAGTSGRSRRLVAEPLCAAPEVVELVVRRWREASQTSHSDAAQTGQREEGHPREQSGFGIS
jgi:sirohydrochlorin ferrochelatase